MSNTQSLKVNYFSILLEMDHLEYFFFLLLFLLPPPFKVKFHLSNATFHLSMAAFHSLYTLLACMSKNGVAGVGRRWRSRQQERPEDESSGLSCCLSYAL